MIPQIEAFYPRIGQAALDALAIDFLECWINAEVGDGFSAAEMFVKTIDGSYHYLSEGVEAISVLFYQLHAAFVSNGEQPFCTATFWMDASGKFSIDYGYESSSEFDDELAKRAKWIDKYLGQGVHVDYS